MTQMKRSPHLTLSKDFDLVLNWFLLLIKTRYHFLSKLNIVLWKNKLVDKMRKVLTINLLTLYQSLS